ncbi:hypothetical protein B4W74_09090 [Staphylococcus intermedius]|uniref:Uncharacterized protein n=1 Tax=Staphylococcus intermedius NCTC 11048 TaxID=1141106 RepID=A0A380G3A7_STAIN|nr:DUF6007 family protein [Staphylococcus intermedius]PCF64052.1 hypothetical protein B5C04_08740 [Staphylococcus intermedius]PCF78767.1 hypothetical protein B4W74_09090 [Staphylococcus intermedius]PCF79740.1 hypothetical protein B4W70_08730 [Staphylococcus intermedius]PCF85910.1 hypothetical protein B4W76_09205 [Staphylococcus intermedius]PCF89601.1 hypothetical protein B4W75_01815 [Staphylococcus intermedius]
MDNFEEELKRYAYVYLMTLIPMSFIIKILPKNTWPEFLLSLIIVMLSSIGLSTVIIYIIHIYKKKKTNKGN